MTWNRNAIQYRVVKKTDTILVFMFFFLLDALYLQVLFTTVSFALNDVFFSSADVNRFCFYAPEL